jgi:hypothetical protein
MNKLTIKSKQILFAVSNLEKKHKIITYFSLLFLTVSTYFLRSENQDVKIEFATIKERNSNLIQNMVIYNRSYESFPLPVWQKVKRGNHFVLQYANGPFVEHFGHNFNYDKYQIIGKNNFQIFPKNTAQDYYESDIAVAITGDEIEGIYKAFDENGDIITTRALKWREIKDQKDTLVYGIIKEIISVEKANLKKDLVN